MTEGILIPVWLFALLVILAFWAVLDRIMIPGVRWYLRQRIGEAIEIINRHLVIEIRPFQLTKRQVLIDRVVYDPEMMETIRTHAAERGVPRDSVIRLVTGYAREIVPAFNAIVYFRMGYRLARAVSRLLYRVRLGFEGKKELSGIDREATVVFVMNHRSNMDYILLSLVAAESTALSYAVGEWAKIWPIQTLIRSLGGYFVRRKGGNPLYRKVLERYVHMATKEGVCQALFPEGGLSRDGRLRPLKKGILDYMLRSFDPVRDRDIVFVPVGINYDRTLEDRTLLRDLDPGAEKRSKWFAVKSTAAFAWHNVVLMMRQRWHRFGHACVYFGNPISAAGYCRERSVRFCDMDRERRHVAVEELSELMGKAIARVIPGLPVGLIAAVFIKEPERAFNSLSVKTRAAALAAVMKRAGAPVFPLGEAFEGELERALRMMRIRHMLVETEEGYRVNPGMEVLLAYYANAVNHYFDHPPNDGNMPD